jgi:hypothetical protein
VLLNTPGVSYYPVLADMQALGSVLKEQGYNLPLSPYHYLVNQSRSCMEVSSSSLHPDFKQGPWRSTVLCHGPSHHLFPL